MTVDISVSEDDDDSSSNSDSQVIGRRKKKSRVWDYFRIQKVNTTDFRARCNQCKKSFVYISGSKLCGTSHLKRHMLGICPGSQWVQKIEQLKHDTLLASSSNINTNGLPRQHPRTNIYGHEFAKMIIKQDYSLHMGEHSGFINFAQTIRPKYPKFWRITADTIQEQIKSVYYREKLKLKNRLTKIPGRLNLAVDLWTSNQRLTYLLISGHFTDHKWKLQRRILNLVEVPFSNAEAAVGHSVASCLSDWNFEGKLFTVTLDRSLVNENSEGVIRGLQSIGNAQILNGQLIIKSCYGCVLSNLAQDAFGSVKEIIEKVRHSVKYVKTPGIREEKFIKLKEKLQVHSAKNLMIDDSTKWNSTYDMLVAASELKEVFSCLDTYDQEYKLTPSMEEWNQVESLCIYLKIFYEAAQIIASPVYPTTNMLFHDVWIILYELKQGAVSEDFFIGNLTKSLLEKFTKYWEECYLVLTAAVVMDPRFKMKLVEFSFLRIYGQDTSTWIKTVSSNLDELFLDYLVQSLPTPMFFEGDVLVEGDDTMGNVEVAQEDSLLNDVLKEFDNEIFLSDFNCEEDNKSELDLYLEEPLMRRVQDFDVLGWWKSNRSKYPTLSKMACDMLSIPLSALPPENVFDTRGSRIDSHRSTLSHTTLEALICSKDWLRNKSSSHTEIRSEAA